MISQRKYCNLIMIHSANFTRMIYMLNVSNVISCFLFCRLNDTHYIYLGAFIRVLCLPICRSSMHKILHIWIIRYSDSLTSIQPYYFLKSSLFCWESFLFRHNSIDWEKKTMNNDPNRTNAHKTFRSARTFSFFFFLK